MEKFDIEDIEAGARPERKTKRHRVNKALTDFFIEHKKTLDKEEWELNTKYRNLVERQNLMVDELEKLTNEIENLDQAENSIEATELSNRKHTLEDELGEIDTEINDLESKLDEIPKRFQTVLASAIPDRENIENN